MCPCLIGSKRPRECNYSRKDSDNHLHAFSPVRQRQAPTPPPKIRIHFEGPEDTILLYPVKDDNSVAKIRQVKIQKLLKRNTVRGSEMNDFNHYPKRDQFDEFMFRKQSETSLNMERDSEYLLDMPQDLLYAPNQKSDETLRVLYTNTRKDKKIGNKRKFCKTKYSPSEEGEGQYSKRRNNFSDTDSCHSFISKNSEGIIVGEEHCQCLSPKTSSKTFRGVCTLTKLQRLYKDFHAVEEISELGVSPKSKAGKKVNSKLTKWNWLLGWLDGPQRKRKISQKKNVLKMNRKGSTSKRKRVRWNHRQNSNRKNVMRSLRKSRKYLKKSHPNQFSAKNLTYCRTKK